MIFNTFTDFIAIATTLVIAFTIHEFSHAVVADYLGDYTPRSQGRITLNPLKHLDLIGSVMFVATGFGWARPVSVNPRNFRNGPIVGMAIVAAAGPLSNLAMAFLAAVPVRLEIVPQGVMSIFFNRFIFFNVLLMFFNFLPVVPLDGFKVAVGLLPREWSYKLADMERYGFMPLFILIILDRFIPILSFLVVAPTGFVARILTG